jgi:hypothetical protein
MERTPLLLLSAVLPFGTVAIAQWSTPVPMANLNSTANESTVSPTPDGLKIYLGSDRTGGAGYSDIYTATRAARYAAFGPPTRVVELASPLLDLHPFPRLDDLEIFFTRGFFPYDLWRADRPSTSVPFNPPVPVTELNSAGSDVTPCLTVDGLRIYFASDRGGSYDIWTATRPNWTSPFGTPTPVTELNTMGRDYMGRISPEGLTIFFTSDRPGGLGGLDIWMASRLDVASPFGNVANVTALNSSANDSRPGFAFFHDEIFFGSWRPGGMGVEDVYTARFTGLVSAGIAGVGSTMHLRFSDPSSSGMPYVAASALGSTPGIQLGTRNLPLNPDPLLTLTVGGLPPVLTGYRGLLDNDGTAAGRITFTGYPQLVGLRFFTAFVVLDPAAPFWIKTISNPLEVQVQ